MKKLLLMILFVSLVSNTFAQKDYPTYTANAKFLGVSQPLKDFPIIVPTHNNDPQNFKYGNNEMRYPKKFNQNALPLNGEEKAQRDFGGIHSYALEENFDGTSITETQGFVPPDPTGAVGPNHYVHAVNSAFKIFDKSGNVLAGPSNLGTLWPGNVNDGDPIILYDQLADRWFISQFNTSNNGLMIAVSTTPDPTGTYNTWEYPLDSFPDYPHYTIWHDAYYMTANKSANNTFALDRQALIDGDANPAIVGFTLPGIIPNTNTVFSPEPANLLGGSYDANTPGYIVYLQDDGWSGAITEDHLKIWEIDMDWVTTSNSTVSSVPLQLPTVPFESTFAPFGTGDVAQPGTTQKIDMIGGVISYMVNYRKFAGHNSMIVTFNVDVDGSDTSGIRWFELRNDSSNPWSIYQEGTYAPADGHSRFMGSAAIDAQGNIGLGFNIASTTLPAGIRYTGRYFDDPLGTMTVAETTIVDGIGVQTFSNRFGDYSHLTMDPDDFTFWHTAEYFTATNSWSTRIASFSLSGGFENDLGVADIISPSDATLGSTESVQVRVKNYGVLDQSNFDIELRLDDVLVATETYAGTLTAGTSDTFTFAQTVDLSTGGQTYVLKAKTILGSDEFNANDEFTKNVRNVFLNDVGVTAITAPESGEGLGSEIVTVTIENFGTADQTGFNVNYIIDGGTPVVETVGVNVPAGSSISYSFATQANLSTVGAYSFTSSTLLGGDGDASNNMASSTVINFDCTTATNDANFPIGPNAGTVTESIINIPDNKVIADINVTVNLFHTFDGDLQIKLVGPDNTEVILSDENGGSGSNYTDTVFDDDASVNISSGSAPFTGSFIPDGDLNDFNGLSSAGDWKLVITDNYNQDGGALLDWTIQICADNGLSIGDSLVDTNLIVVYKGNGQYLVKLPTSTEKEGLKLSVMNALGQIIFMKSLENESGQGYQYNLDMSNASSGVYFVRIGNNRAGNMKRIIVD
jgi:subtilisin-like proprotein convertase family protein